jgi:hypothetical protein
VRTPGRGGEVINQDPWGGRLLIRSWGYIHTTALRICVHVSVYVFVSAVVCVGVCVCQTAPCRQAHGIISPGDATPST